MNQPNPANFIFTTVIIFFLTMAFAHAQDPTEEDSFDDYSHLWEDDKAKEKAEKKRLKEEKKQQKKQRQQGVSSSTNNTANTEDSSNTGSANEPTDLSDLATEDFRAGLPGLDPANYFSGGFTYANVGGESLVGLTLSPEFKLGKVGIGLNVPLLYSLDDNSFRSEIFTDGIGVARLITYVRYGVQKADPVYIKVGQLDNTMIGFGSLVNNYTNSTSYEKRKIGLHYDVNIKGMYGIEGMYSDFDPASLNLLVLRPYVRPLASTGIPIVKTLEFGATYVRDGDQTDIPVTDDTSTKYTFTEPGISAFGLDMGVTLLRVPFIQIDLFAGYSKLNVESDVLTTTLTNSFNATGEPSQMSDGFSNGSGISAGVNFRMHFIADIFSTDVRIERLNYNEHYLPQFFDGAYEINKDAKILSLGSAKAMSGIYGSLTGHILKKIRLGGSLLIPDDISENAPAVIRLNADLPRLGDKISIHGSYIKGNLADLGDAFTFDENSLAKLRFIYHLNDFFVTGIDYYWAFSRVDDGSYKATKFVAPYFGLNIQF